MADGLAPRRLLQGLATGKIEPVKGVRQSGWSDAPLWRGPGEPIFARALREAARAAGSRDAALFLREDLLSREPARRQLVRVGRADGREPGERIATPRWIGEAGSGAPRWQAKSRALAFGIRLEGEPAGLLRLQLPKAPFPAELPALTLAAERLAATLERDRLARRLEAAQGHYRTILEAAGDGILIVDAASGKVVEANRRAAQLSRFRAVDLVGRLLWTLLGDEEGGDARRRLGRRAGHRPILRLLRRRGGALPVAVTFARVPGPRPLLHLILSDVSVEERARRELTQAKETLASIAVAASRLQGTLDRRSVFDVVGRELGRLGFHSATLLPESEEAPDGPWRIAQLGRPDEAPEPPGILLDERFSPARFPLLARALESGRAAFSGDPAADLRAIAPGVSRREAAAAVRRLGVTGMIVAPFGEGTPRHGALLVAGAAVRSFDAEAVEILARQASQALERARLYDALRSHSADLEAEVERRTRELTLAVRALREIDRRKDNFLANVSHELRTPLVTVLGYTQLLLDGRVGPLTDEQRRCLDVAGRSGKRLREFIEELLDFSRHELTRESLRPAPFDVREAVDLAVAGLHPKILERGLSVRSRIARGTPRVFGERERLVQVLSNLLSNAERHCEQGGRLRIAVAPGGGRVRVSVSDDGSGIPTEHRDRIFERLYQVGDRAAAREKGAGLGLGLAIAKSIVEAHGGRIWVDGRPRRGSRFRFEVPSAELVLGERG